MEKEGKDDQEPKPHYRWEGEAAWDISLEK